MSDVAFPALDTFIKGGRRRGKNKHVQGKCLKWKETLLLLPETSRSIINSGVAWHRLGTTFSLALGQLEEGKESEEEVGVDCFSARHRRRRGTIRKASQLQHQSPT